MRRLIVGTLIVGALGIGGCLPAPISSSSSGQHHGRPAFGERDRCLIPEGCTGGRR